MKRCDCSSCSSDPVGRYGRHVFICLKGGDKRRRKRFPFPPWAPRRAACDKTYERRSGSEIFRRRRRRFFISHLSKSGSCGIKTDTVAVDDLVGRGWRIIQREGERARDRERERERAREMRKRMIPTNVRIDFPWPPGRWRG